MGRSNAKEVESTTAWRELQQRVIECELCPRLRAHCLHIAKVKRAAFLDQTYWGRPVPNFGNDDAQMLIVGLAPAAHGANRTGRVFTGDRSGDFLFRALHETGFANQPTSLAIDDGLQLIDAVITATARCAPPDNKPLPDELANCSTYLNQTFDLMTQLRVVVALGRIAFDHCLRQYGRKGWLATGPKPAFGHGKAYAPPGAPVLIACFHPSQQNTFTGRLTPEMIRRVFEQARQVIRRDA